MADAGSDRLAERIRVVGLALDRATALAGSRQTMKPNQTRIIRAAATGAGVLAALAAAVAAPAPARVQDATWNGLVVAPEARCSPYDSDDYRYSQSVEDRIIRRLGGVYGPYSGRWFGSKRETDIEHIPGPRPTTAASAGPMPPPGGGSPRTCAT